MATNEIELRLYIAGDTSRSRVALGALRRLEETVDGCRVEVVDILEQPGRAEEDRILATPTLVRVSPAPQRRVVGDLGSLEKLREALGTPHPRWADGAASDGGAVADAP